MLRISRYSRLWLLPFIVSAGLAQSVYWVDMKNGNDNNNGTSEATAFKTVHYVFQNNIFSNNDTIKIKPSLDANGNLSYYDFGGSEITENNNNKDFVLIGVEGPDKTIFDAESKNRHFHIVNKTNKTSIEGITFRNGKETQSYQGASIDISNSDITFKNCKWVDNELRNGYRGGAIVVNRDASASFYDSHFKNNRIIYDDKSNTGNSEGGAIYIEEARDQNIHSQLIKIHNSIFEGNHIVNFSNSYGGAIASYRQTEVVNTVFMDNSLTWKQGDNQNYAEMFGGAAFFDTKYWNGSSYTGGTSTVVNSTFDNNYINMRDIPSNGQNLYGGTIAYGRWENNTNSKFFMFNSIITRNGFLQEGQHFDNGDNYRQRNAIVGTGNENGYKASIDYSMIEGNSTMNTVGDYVYDVAAGYKDSANHDYSLSDKSPLLGAGVSTWDDEGLPAPGFDIAGFVRPTPAPSQPDLGAYENAYGSPQAPLPVSNLTVQSKSNSVELNWNAVKTSLSGSADATGIEYHIYKSNDRVGKTDKTSFTVTGLTNGTSYSFKVLAMNSSGVESIASKTVSAIPKYSGPWYVAASGGKSPNAESGNYNYGSSEYPINHLTNAMSLVAEGDTIIIMEGTHTGSNNRGINPSNKMSLVIMGDSKSSADKVIIDAAGRDNHFTFDNGEDTTFVLQNISLINGDGSSSGGGGGSVQIYNNSSVKLVGIIFRDNIINDQYRSGGALAIDNSYAIIDQCQFINNSAQSIGDNNTTSTHGGAISVWYANNKNQRTVISNSIFRNNKSISKQNARGAAVYIEWSIVDMINNVFENNKSAGSVNNNGWGSEGTIHARSIGFWNNAINQWDGASAVFINNTLVNNKILQSNGGWAGAAIEYYADQNMSTKAQLTSFNNIIYGNKLIRAGQIDSNPYQYRIGDNEISTFSDYNLIEGLFSNPDLSFEGDNSVSFFPAFTDSANNDFSLTDKSLALGAGTASLEGYSAPTTDITGSIRPNPAGSNPDLGAYENALARSPYPVQVKQLSAVGGSGEITISWEANPKGDNVKHYNVYMHTEAFDIGNKYLLGNTEQTSFKKTGLDNGTRYYFKVAAVNTDNLEGTPSNTIDLTPSYSGPVWWIATNGNDTNEGSSGNPFASLEKALERVNDGDTIIFRPGTYSDTKNSRVKFHSDTPKGLVIKAEERRQVILDGNGRTSPIFEFETENNNDILITKIDTTFIIDGIDFTNSRGRAIKIGYDSWNPNYGPSPKFTHCSFYDNEILGEGSDAIGGAIMIYQGSSIIENSLFENNSSSGSGGGAIGFARYSIDFGPGGLRDQRLIIRNSTFKKNSTSFQGGAVFVNGQATTTTIINSIFENNNATSQPNSGSAEGGAVYINNGQANLVSSGQGTNFIHGSYFKYNYTVGVQGNTYGGAIHIRGEASFQNNIVASNYQLNTSSQNSQAQGGGLYIDAEPLYTNDGNYILPRSLVLNNTIVFNRQFQPWANQSGNECHYAAGLFAGGGDAEMIIMNNIIYFNGDLDDPQNHCDLGIMSTSVAPSRFFVNNTVNGFYTNNEVYQALNRDNSNLDIAPVFVDTNSYALDLSSALIGAGRNSYDENYSDSVNAPSIDYDGNKRPLPANSNVDLGAIESSLGRSPYPSMVMNLKQYPGDSQMTLSWSKNPENDIDRYIVYQGGENFIATRADSVGETTDTTFTVYGLDNNFNYFFRVSAVNSLGYEGPASEDIQTTPYYNGPTWWIASGPGLPDADGSKDRPFSHARDGFLSMSPGDTVVFKVGKHSFMDGVIHDFSNLDFHIRGETGNPRDVILSGEGSYQHFAFEGEYNVTISDLTFANGVARNDQQSRGGGGGSLHVGQGANVIINNCLFYQNTSERFAWEAGGAILAINYENIEIRNSVFRSNGNQQGQPIGGSAIFLYNENQDAFNTKIINNRFISNFLNIGNENDNTFGNGGIISINATGVFEGNEIDSSRVFHNYSGGGKVSFSGAVVSWPRGNEDDLANRPLSYFTNNTIRNSYIRVSGNVSSAWFQTDGRPIEISNNLIHNNYVTSEIQDSDAGTNNGGMGVYNFSQNINVPQFILNNTITNNTIEAPPGGLSFGAGLNLDPGGEGSIEVVNNIIVGNLGQSNQGLEISNVNWGGDVERINFSNNLFDFTLGLGKNEFIGNPKFKNPSSQNFELQAASIAVDAGLRVLPNDYPAPIVDNRGFYRVGNPDLGAFERGGSKYILDLVDDLDENKDTTFVDRGQSISFTITTNDINGNIVPSNESVSWSVFPNQKYVKLVSGDQTTAGGDATASFEVTDQNRSKGFRFRIEASVGEATFKSKLYVIEEIVTGAPPPVVDVTISPSGWSTDPNFTVSWKTPVWLEQRELIGAVVDLTDGANTFSQYLSFPSGDTLTQFSFEVPEAGKYDASIWLVDELGNEDKDSSRVISAYFDNIPPEQFLTYNPDSDSEDGSTTYTSDKPRFEWEDRGDFPSGIKEWRLMLNDSFYKSYTYNDVSFYNESNIAYIEIDEALDDGYYTWWMEAVDQAEIITKSDSGYFGVDLSAPNIVHNNPLTEIDENTTSPSINANFTDAASGVEYGRLHYRRAGSNSGFISLDLLNGPVNIPGSDVKSVGVEYYISSEDELGNYSRWPEDKELQSVRVRTANNVRTADNWPNGIPGGIDTSSYVFFSIPFDVGNARSAILSVLDPENKGPDMFAYRLFAYNNGWEENPTSVTTGNGYFLVYDPDKYQSNPQMNFTFDKGVSAPTVPPYEIASPTGQWKFFGNPYNFPVDLIDVRTKNDIPIVDGGSIFTWTGLGGWVSPGPSIEPWKGYIYKSASDPDIIIDGSINVFGKRLAKTATPEINNISMDLNEWIVNILASTGRSRDESNSVGVLKMALDGHDRLDEFEPPSVPGNISLSIDNRDRDEVPDIYSVDIRKPNDEGHYWDLEVIAPTNGQRTYLTFEGLGYVPEEYDIFIINKTNKQAQNLKWESGYRFANTGSGSYLKQDLRTNASG